MHLWFFGSVPLPEVTLPVFGADPLIPRAHCLASQSLGFCWFKDFSYPIQAGFFCSQKGAHMEGAVCEPICNEMKWELSFRIRLFFGTKQISLLSPVLLKIISIYQWASLTGIIWVWVSASCSGPLKVLVQDIMLFSLRQILPSFT